jgi:hypothetical protein
MTTKTINFKGYKLVVFKSKYRNRANNINSVALLKYSKDISKDNYAFYKTFILSINILKNNIDDNHFFLRAYAENKEISDFLFEEGYLIKKNTIKYFTYGNHKIVIYEVEMTEKFMECIIEL